MLNKAKAVIEEINSIKSKMLDENKVLPVRLFVAVRYASKEASCRQAAAGDSFGISICFLGADGRRHTAMLADESEPSSSEERADSEDTVIKMIVLVQKCFQVNST